MEVNIWKGPSTTDMLVNAVHAKAINEEQNQNQVARPSTTNKSMPFFSPLLADSSYVLCWRRGAEPK